MRKKCRYLESFWSAISCIQTEHRDLLCKSPYSVRMRENTDQKNSEYRHIFRSGYLKKYRHKILLTNYLTWQIPFQSQDLITALDEFKINHKNNRSVMSVAILKDLKKTIFCLKFTISTLRAQWNLYKADTIRFKKKCPLYVSLKLTNVSFASV